MDCSNIRHVGVHREQFDAIQKKADVIILSCIEDGRVLSFRRMEDVSEPREYSVDDVIRVLHEFGKQHPVLKIGIDAPANGHVAVIGESNIYEDIHGDIMVDCE